MNGLAETSQAVSQYLQGVQKRESRHQLHDSGLVPEFSYAIANLHSSGSVVEKSGILAIRVRVRPLTHLGKKEGY